VNSERILFESVKEDRGWYFVEYSPPIGAVRFACLDLTIPEVVDRAKIVEAMEAELVSWLNRYPIPLMVSAFDGANNLIHLKSLKGSNSLMGFCEGEKKSAISSWRLLSNEELPSDALDRNHLKRVYSDIPFKTSKDVEYEVEKHKRMVLTVRWFFFFWAVVVPLTVIILGETSVWVARMVLAYSVWKVLVEALKQTGKWKKSSRELEKDREELEMWHHHYHCKKNPEAFLRLKVENLEREERERVRKEAESLKRKR
jgi:hypothetical protein